MFFSRSEAMEIKNIENQLKQIVCDILNVENYDVMKNLLGPMGAYELLYVIDYIENIYGITAKKLFEDLCYTEMTIKALSNKIEGILVHDE